MMNIAEIIESTAPQFKKLASHLKFESECLFAKQQLLSNGQAMAAAKSNPNALKAAILNVAAIDISLNPASKLAYLVPRKKNKDSLPEICLDISYRGLIRLATDTGVIKWARVQLVYEGDHFVYKGPACEPEFVGYPFATKEKKGNFLGGFVIAKTLDGDILTEAMSNDEIEAVKQKSMGADSFYSPWKMFEDEMRKKSIIKRASKTWPYSSGRERFDTAIDVLNEHEGLDLEHKVEFFDEDMYSIYAETIKNKNALMYAAIEQAYDNETLAALNTAYKKQWPGTVAQLTEIMKNLSQKGDSLSEDYAVTVEEMLNNDDQLGASEYINELNETEQAFVMTKISPRFHNILIEVNGA